MRGDSVKGELLVYQSFIPGVSTPCHYNEYQLRLDVQRFLWPVYYVALHFFLFLSSKATAPEMLTEV